VSKSEAQHRGGVVVCGVGVAWSRCFWGWLLISVMIPWNSLSVMVRKSVWVGSVGSERCGVRRFLLLPCGVGVSEVRVHTPLSDKFVVAVHLESRCPWSQTVAREEVGC